MAGRPTTLDEMLEHENHELPQFDADAIAEARLWELLEDWRREAREEAEDTFG